ncbi:MAG: cytochrome C biogenesis protein [Oscillospiraceae bacterium]|nr:cytochrome C biogenesis protein [Oscillospiraceae bacterium]
MAGTTVKLEVYLPPQTLEPLRQALDQAGLCRVGNYSHVMAVQPSRGYWKSLEGSDPWLGTVGELTQADELKVEFPCPAERAEEAAAIIRRVHPYEEPVYYIIPVQNDIF